MTQFWSSSKLGPKLFRIWPSTPSWKIQLYIFYFICIKYIRGPKCGKALSFQLLDQKEKQLFHWLNLSKIKKTYHASFHKKKIQTPFIHSISQFNIIHRLFVTQKKCEQNPLYTRHCSQCSYKKASKIK